MLLPAILIPAPMPADVMAGLAERFILHRLWKQPDPDAFLASVAPSIRGLATNTLAGTIDASWFDRLPALEIVSSFGVGYDRVDTVAAVVCINQALQAYSGCQSARLRDSFAGSPGIRLKRCINSSSTAT